MAVKYTCPKCNKRFIDWGAKKLDFKCPDCKDEALVLVGHESSQSRSAKRPSLKRTTRSSVKKPPPAPVPVVEEALDADITDAPLDLLDGGQEIDGESMDDTDGPPLVDESGKAKPTEKKAAKSKSSSSKAKPKAKAKVKPKAKPKAKAKVKAKAKAKPKAKPKAKKKAKK
ncbi:MAG: hypothetical protein IID08_06520 [Candidatus Hydrogenedentes bacterium]|nr:hypothetical protein [Candidatus Hydrogenedentota bacterium]